MKVLKPFEINGVMTVVGKKLTICQLMSIHGDKMVKLLKEGYLEHDRVTEPLL